jgi:uncharacterized small protein (DUF1192 family)
MEYKGLPIFKASIGDADGMVVCSFVDDPAVESQFLAYAKDEKPMQFSIENEDKHIVIGVAMRANFPIYRYNASMGEFYIVYTPEVIREMVQKFFRNGYQNNVDVDHSFQLEDGVYIEQAFIKDTENGINPKGFDEIEDGSLFFQYKVENEEIWNGIKDGTFKGFSIAGTFGIEETYTKQNNNNEDKLNKTMSKLQRIKEALRSILVEFGEVSTDKGVIVFDGDELEAGMEVKGIDEQGNEIQLEDGDYKTEDQKIIVVKDGKVEEIKDDEAEVATDEPSVEEPTEEQENADEEPTEEPTEEPKEDEGEDKDAIIEELKARIAELEKENEELKAKLDEEPAAPSASEAFEHLEVEDDNTPAGKLRKRGYKF